MNKGSSLAVIRLSGELDIGRRDEIAKALVVSGSETGVLIDFAEVTYADSTTLTQLLRFRAEAEHLGINLAIVIASRQFARLIQYAGLSEAFHIFNDRGERACVPQLGRAMIESSELRIYRYARPDSARPMRHALASFLSALEIDADRADDILMAVGEALANALEHAYGGVGGEVELHARVCEPRTLSVDVADRGEFIEREARPGRGFGLRIVTTVARAVTLEKAGGTRVTMIFDTASERPEFARQA